VRKVKELSPQIARRLYELDPETNDTVSDFFSRRVLALLAEVAKEPSIAYATIYDYSQVSDYLMCCWIDDQEEGQQILAALTNKLGVPINFSDRIIDLALKIRN
jgi:hypothetical protein